MKFNKRLIIVVMLVGMLLASSIAAVSAFLWHQDPRNSRLYMHLNGIAKVHINKIVFDDIKNQQAVVIKNTFGDYLDSAFSKSIAEARNLPNVQKVMYATIYFDDNKKEMVAIDLFLDSRLIAVSFPVDRLDDSTRYAIYFDQNMPKELESKLRSMLKKHQSSRSSRRVGSDHHPQVVTKSSIELINTCPEF